MMRKLVIELAFILQLISAIRFKEDTKIITEPDEILYFQLISESPRDGQKVTFTLHTIDGAKLNLVENHELSDDFEFRVPENLAGTGMAEIIARSETGAECSTIIFIK